MALFTRRAWLGMASAVTLTSAAGLRAAPDQKLKVVVTGGHPGDPEYGCGGTIARYTDLGHEVCMLYLNRGDVTCPAIDPAHDEGMRVQEAGKAASILKARIAFADQCDGHAVVDAERYDQFRRLIEAQNPDVVFTHWPIDNHRDHRAIANLTYDVWVKNKKFALYFYEVSSGEDTQMFVPGDYVDISNVAGRKREACFAHASQTPDRYYTLQDDVAKFRGLESGYARAEAFRHHAPAVRGLLP
jgi:LmbE family N-acetylglucosaminyl deacetylase